MKNKVEKKAYIKCYQSAAFHGLNPKGIHINLSLLILQITVNIHIYMESVLCKFIAS